MPLSQSPPAFHRWWMSIALAMTWACAPDATKPSEHALGGDEESSAPSKVIRDFAGAQPEGLLAVLPSKASTSSTLRVQSGRAFDIALRWPSHGGFKNVSPTDADWGFGRFVLRTPGGYQDTVPTADLLHNGRQSVTISRPGGSFFALCMGPKVQRSAHAWQDMTYCTKVMVRVDGPAGQPNLTDAGFTGKIGLPLEALAYRSPLLARVGDDLPVRFYVHGKAKKEQTVQAYRPDGTVDTQVTNAIGLANFRLTQNGAWLIRMVTQHDGKERVAELAFELAAGGGQ